MKIFVFTYDRFDTITTSAMLEAEGLAHTVLCHTDEQRDKFTAGGRVKPERLVVTGQPRGLAYNRNAALDMMDDGEWACFLVDDLRRVTELDSYDSEPDDVLPITTGNAGEWRERFKREISMAAFLHRGEAGAREADRLGGHLAGFAGIDNALFRRRHWALNVLADGRAWMVRKTALRFDERVQMIDDVCWTALNLHHFGVVVVNAWVLPLCRRYTAGGFGSMTARMDQKREEAAYLVERYPHLVAFKAKAGWPPGTHVVLRRATPPRERTA